ncbi:MAG TPA: hypothetical protein VGH89_09010 [Pseudonocardia sp.]|jgi:syndecan 1
MTADHGETPVPNRYPQPADAEGRFEIVVRGYDRRQVDEHITNLERTIARQRAELQQARSGAAQPAAAPASGGHGPEKIGEFTGRLKSILEAAEDEAKDIRAEARNYARAEEEAARARLADLERRRDGVATELGRVRGQLDGILARLGGGASSPGPNTGPNSVPKAGPKTPAEGNALSPRQDKPLAARSDKPAGPSRPDSGPRTDPGRRPEPAARPEQPARTDRHEPNGSPRIGSVPASGDQSRPSSRPAVPEDAGRSTARPQPSTPQVSPGMPASKPRPTPSPRPRVAPPSSGMASQAAGEQPHTRNGVISRENGVVPKRDEDGGPSAFGSGAR